LDAEPFLQALQMERPTKVNSGRWSALIAFSDGWTTPLTTQSAIR
jgi:hypothetical protein